MPGASWPTTIAPATALLELAAMACAAAAKDPAAVVRLSAHQAVSGSVKGRVAEFLGIPYADPPVGPLRWKPPRTANLTERWNGTLPCSEYRPRCIQMGTPFSGEPAVDYEQLQAYMGVHSDGDPIPGQSEDCLYLNVYTPLHTVAPGNGTNNSSGHICGPLTTDCNVCPTCCHSWIAPTGAACDACFKASCNDGFRSGPPPTELLPVMLYIHGGAYEAGTGSDQNGTALVSFSPGAVVVTIQCELSILLPAPSIHLTYDLAVLEDRLNVFGFLGASQLRNRSDGSNSTGNYGLLDQREAMRWVKKHSASIPSELALCIDAHTWFTASCSSLFRRRQRQADDFWRVSWGRFRCCPHCYAWVIWDVFSSCT
eukprot:SAG31_NODE_8401_length_1458_cov_2.197204_1_plen_370_part_00